MAKKKKISKAKAQESERMIQYVGVGLVLIVIALIAWQNLPKPQSNAGAGGTACSVFDSIAAAEQYEAAPPQLIDESKQYFANVKMANGGEFVIELLPADAPITVNSFVFLACKNFFDGVTFHRVLDGFMAQGGDPTGTGMGGPGYQFVNEDSALIFAKPGVVAMANSGRDTNGSQFFITFDAADFLNGGYTIFGQVTEGMEVVNAITRRDPDQSPAFEGDAIETITISVE